MYPRGYTQQPRQGETTGPQHVPYGLMRPDGAPSINEYQQAGIHGHTTDQAMMDMRQ
ncbi:hypothetical protein FIBSPDRAFT_848509 [Athelia psychrophila]|uniref:Uncharacterized protein n=1 Tax=Athelia psychrophila TaxID=1759441 RepID=A0A166UYH7_9AGAM|nr:hypothetical protein FIBSPDRAFT_848509 [Fibularhizoctonia sp. CBS 109695]